MKLVIGIDVGGSTTKIVGYWENRTLLGVQRVVAQDPVTSMYGALGRFISENHLQLCQVSRIVLTGVGATCFNGDLYGIPTTKVSEFIAIGLGGLELAKKKEAVVVSLGTGTAFVRAAYDSIVHIGGSGVGGGTISGLCERLAKASSFETVMQMAQKGDTNKVDLTIGDISSDKVGNMAQNITASNFGKAADDATPEDMVAGVINMVFQTVGLLAIFACRNCTIRDIVLTGTLTSMPQARQVFDALESLHPVNFIIPENAVFATAIGAALSLLDSPQPKLKEESAT